MNHKSYTSVSGVDLMSVVSHLQGEAQSRGFSFEELEGGAYRCVTPLGVFEIGPEDQAIRIDLSADRKDALYNLQEGVVGSFARLSDDLASSLSWSGTFSEGEPPPNFHTVRVVSTERVNSIYRRVRVAGDDLGGFAEGGMHFRLLIARNPDQMPVYPVVGSNGRTVWPKGDQALHKPVYTTRNIDVANGLLDFDVFVHEGGRTTQWARDAQAGDAVALIGPGGGGIPEAGTLLMAGDETAVPAISRILESVPKKTTGTAFLMVPDPEAIIPFTRPENFQVNWLCRNKEPGTLLDALKAVSLPDADRFVWFAGERREAQAARDHFKKGLGLDATESYLAAFWRS